MAARRRSLSASAPAAEFHWRFSPVGATGGTGTALISPFTNEDFTPDLRWPFEPDFCGQRRTRVEEYYHAIGFAERQIFRLLRNSHEGRHP